MEYKANRDCASEDMYLRLSLDQAMIFCKMHLLGAQFSVVQVGERTLLGRKNDRSSTVEVTLQKLAESMTQVTYLLLV